MKLILILFIMLASNIALANQAEICSKLLIKILVSSPDVSAKEVIRFKSKWSRIVVDSPSDNRLFIQRTHTPQKGHLYFQVENAVLKELNDKIFVDKELVTDIDTANKFFAFEAQNRHPLLIQHMGSHYTDFKTLALAKDSDGPAVVAELKNLYVEMMTNNKEMVEELGLQSRYQSGSGLIKDPKHWYLAGMGDTNDKANFATRAGRFFFKPGEMSVLNFEALVDFFYEKLAVLKGLHKEILTKAPELHYFKSKHPVLREDLIDIFRKVRANDLDEYVAYCQKRIQNRFKFNASRELILKIRDYFNLSNLFSPSLLVEKRVVIDMEKSVFGNVSVDIAGMGSRNMKTLMEAISAVDINQSPDEIFQAIRDSEIEATEELNNLRNIISDNLIKTESSRKGVMTQDISDDLQMTGDDIIFFPSNGAYERKHKLDFLKRLVRSGDGHNFRTVFLPQLMNDGHPIRHYKRSNYIVLGENLEKGVRQELEGVIDYDALRKMVMGVDISVDSHGEAHLELFIEDLHFSEEQLHFILDKATMIAKRDKLGRITTLSVIK